MKGGKPTGRPEAAPEWGLSLASLPISREDGPQPNLGNITRRPLPSHQHPACRDQAIADRRNFSCFLCDYLGIQATINTNFFELAPNVVRVLLSIAPETSLMASDRWDHVDIRAVFTRKALIWSPTHIVAIAIMFDLIYTLAQRREGSVKKGAARQCKPRGKACLSRPDRFPSNIRTYLSKTKFSTSALRIHFFYCRYT